MTNFLIAPALELIAILIIMIVIVITIIITIIIIIMRIISERWSGKLCCY